jgi:uncharacterized membrane protein YdfJ with MMPL/SSD domain
VRDRLAVEGSLLEATPEPGRFARFVERRPWLTSLTALAVLALLAIPALEMRLGNADQGNDPEGQPTRIAYDLIAEGFGDGANGPLVVVVDLGELGPLDPAAPPAALAALIADLTADPEIAAAIASPERKAICGTNIPASAMTTVIPANTTARPDVVVAPMTESVTERPALSPSRCRFTMKSA